MHKLSPRQWTLLVLLTLVWGINWPVMKIGVTGFPPLTFQALCLWLGTPILGLVLVAMKVPFRIPRAHWRELLVLAVFNMFIWQALIIIAVQSLSSGRAAILGYTMPMFSALLGAWVFGDQLAKRSWAGVAAASLGVVLLLWHELSNLSGRPTWVLLALAAASTWALGTQMLRRTPMPVPTLAISFWMTLMTTGVLSVLAWFWRAIAGSHLLPPTGLPSASTRCWCLALRTPLGFTWPAACRLWLQR